MTASEDNKRYNDAQKVSLVTLIVNVFLFVIKIISAILSGSSAMLADSIHTFSDVGTTIAVMIGMKLSSKPDDSDHPYGHERIESEFAKILAVLLFITAIGIGYNGISLIISKNYSHPGVSAVWAALISIVIKEAMYHYTVRVANRINSPALKADAWHHRSDALSSIGTLIGIAGARLGFEFLDPVAAIVVSIMIIKVAFDIYVSAFNQMVDKSAGDEVIEKIREVLASTDGIISVDDIKTRMHGAKIYVDIEISVDPNLTVKEGHEIAENVHLGIERNIPETKHCMVHINPASK